MFGRKEMIVTMIMIMTIICSDSGFVMLNHHSLHMRELSTVRTNRFQVFRRVFFVHLRRRAYRAVLK